MKRLLFTSVAVAALATSPALAQTALPNPLLAPGQAATNLGIFSVTAQGARGSFTNPTPAADNQGIHTAFALAGAVCGEVFFPPGEFHLTAQLVLPTCVTVSGTGVTNSLLTTSGMASIIDCSAVTASPCIKTLDGNAAQFTSIRNIQIQKAQGDCFDGSMVYGSMQSVVFSNCGGKAILLSAGSTAATYLTRLADVRIYKSGGDGLTIDSAAQGDQTTIILENLYSTQNAGRGIVANNVNTLTIIGGGADSNAGGYGYDITGSRTVTMIGNDAEKNLWAGQHWNSSNGIVIGARAANNNTGLVGFQPNIALVEGTSKVFFQSVDDTAGHDYTSSSINAVGGTVMAMGGTFSGTLDGSVSQLTEAGGLVLKNLPTSCGAAGTVYNSTGTLKIC